MQPRFESTLRNAFSVFAVNHEPGLISLLIHVERKIVVVSSPIREIDIHQSACAMNIPENAVVRVGSLPSPKTDHTPVRTRIHFPKEISTQETAGARNEYGRLCHDFISLAHR
jgi:hypothetical protein